MSSIARTRSLRKPAVTDIGLKRKTETGQDAPRNVSPSRLPAKAPLTASTSTGPSSSGTRMRAVSASVRGSDGSSGSSSTTATARARPLSGAFGLRRAASVRQPTQSSGGTTAATGSSIASTTASRPPITTRNRPTPRPTSASGASPTLPRPSSSSGVPPASPSSPSRPAGPGHARTRSSVTTLTSATTLRPPSYAPSTAPDRTARVTASPSTRLTHARVPSTSSISSPTAPTPPPRRRAATTQTQTQTQTQPNTQPNTQPHHPNKPAPKPAFSTLQQHYTPAKTAAPKPPTASYLAPPSPSKLPANLALSADTARLQAELLQLHLLHRAHSGGVGAAWRASARTALAARFGAVAEEGRAVERAEGRVVERENVAALLRWGGCGGGRGWGGLEDRVGLLDGVLGSVWGWTESGGKYARLVGRFERWAVEVEGVVERRGLCGGGDGLCRDELLGEMVFVSDLDAGWKEECAALARKLAELNGLLERDLWLREESPGDGDEVLRRSSLERILAGLRSLVADMLAELALMRDVEREAVAQESEWVRAMNRRDDGGGNDTRAGAIWRVV